MYGEKTPSYIYSLEQDGVTEARQLCHKRMHEVVPNAKLILCLRDPIDRAFSHWNMESNRVAAYGISFAEAVDIDLQHMQDPNYIRFSDYDFVQKGFYIEYIENLLRYFPRQQIHICFTEELKTDVEAQYNAIYRFLDLEIPQNAQYSVSSTEYKSEMDPGMRHQLRPIFEPYNKRLFNYLGRDVQAWSN